MIVLTFFVLLLAVASLALSVLAGRALKTAREMREEATGIALAAQDLLNEIRPALCDGESCSTDPTILRGGE